MSEIQDTCDAIIESMRQNPQEWKVGENTLRNTKRDFNVWIGSGPSHYSPYHQNYHWSHWQQRKFHKFYKNWCGGKAAVQLGIHKEFGASHECTK